jgi:carbamoyltransferase
VVLGISAYYHDSAAALVRDGEIVAAAQEERFSRRKNDNRFPRSAIASCLASAGVQPGELDTAVYYEKPLAKLDRVLAGFLHVGYGGGGAFRRVMRGWARRNLCVALDVEHLLRDLGHPRPAQFFFAEHHESHAASAFFPSPYHEAAILTTDGVGEWATATVGRGSGNRLEIREEQRFPHSLGLLYAAFTAYCGFEVNEGEYKLMGLAPYGEPRYVNVIFDNLVDVRADGSFVLNLDYFEFLRGERMINERFERLLGAPARPPSGGMTLIHMDAARSVQAVTEEIVLRMARHAHTIAGATTLCLAGGVALNAVANGRLSREGPFEGIWIQPAAGDAGGAIGSALLGWHQILGNRRVTDGVRDGMHGAYLGPKFDADEIGAFLTEVGLSSSRLPDRAARTRRIAELIAQGAVVGLYTGRMEFGPRALGHRSILADPRRPDMHEKLSTRIKEREPFRPFAPAVLRERRAEYFEDEFESPYMLLVSQVRNAQVRSRRDDETDLAAWASEARSAIPAVTHVDGSARLQTVTRDQSPEFHAVLAAFEDLTGCPVLLNTSMNRRGEPIVCTPEDALDCFIHTGMDFLVLEDYLLSRADLRQAQESALPRGGARGPQREAG